jgi:hypothetical protein
VKPYHVYFRGLNFTKFLTGQQHLTLFTYEVLASLSSEYGWTFRDIRSFFNITFKSKKIKKILSSTPSKKIQKETPIYTKRVAFSSGGIIQNDSCANRSAQDSNCIDHSREVSVIPVDEKGQRIPPLMTNKRRRSASPSEISLSKRMTMIAPVVEPINSQPDVSTEISNKGAKVDNGELDFRTIRLFSKFTNFSAALKLVALNIQPKLRFPQTRFELYYGLMQEGFDTHVLEKFKEYLALKFPSLLTAKGLHQVLNEYVHFGGIAVGDRTVYFDQPLSLVEKSEEKWFSVTTY